MSATIGGDTPAAHPPGLNGTSIFSAGSLPITVARFPSAFAKKGQDALGQEVTVNFGAFARGLNRRREGRKDGQVCVFAIFKPEKDGQVHRVNRKLLARTAIALDIETSKTGAVPPPFAEAVARIRENGWGGTAYTSHSHAADAPRYRIILPLTREIPPHLPVVEFIAAELGLEDVLDGSKVGAVSPFYVPSCAPGQAAQHEFAFIDGEPVQAGWVTMRGGSILAALEAERARVRAEAAEAAAKRRAERIERGLDPNDSLIERIREHLDLRELLTEYHYEQVGDKFLYPGSKTGVAGVHILVGHDGIERVYSHHSDDPLAPAKLPDWCHVKAIDAVDVITILEFEGDLKKALRELKERFAIVDPPRPVTPLVLLWLDDIQPVLEARDFVQGVLYEGGAAAVYGVPTVGKTFWATDLGLHVAAGLRWNGRRVDQGGVIYCALEGGNAFRNRVAAWKKAKGSEPGLPFAAVTASLNLRDPKADTPRLVETVKGAAQQIACPVRLIIVDTLARSLGGGDENSSVDMGALVASMDEIRTQTGACVLFVHHCGKDITKGLRGHSSLLGALDTEIVVHGDAEGAKAATVEKQRDGVRGLTFGFALDVVVLGKNQHGEDVTTCVVRNTAAVPASRGGKLSGAQEAAMRVLRQITAPVQDEAWRSAMVDSHEVTSAQPANRRTAVNHLVTELVRKGLIEISPDGIVQEPL